jgi:hypothetical protein
MPVAIHTILPASEFHAISTCMDKTAASQIAMGAPNAKSV